MTIDTLATELNVEKNIVVQAVISNGFSLDSEDYTEYQKYLIQLYTDYLQAMIELKSVRNAFKYTDGEESVDKSNVYEQHRKYAQDLFDLWKNAKDDFDKNTNNSSSFYTFRRRAGYINARTR